MSLLLTHWSKHLLLLLRILAYNWYPCQAGWISHKLASWSTQHCSLWTWLNRSHGFLPLACALISNLLLDYEMDMLQMIKMGFLPHHAHLKVEHFTICIYVSRPVQRPKQRTMLSVLLGRLSNGSSVLTLIHWLYIELPIWSRLGWSAPSDTVVDDDYAAAFDSAADPVPIDFDNADCSHDYLADNESKSNVDTIWWKMFLGST